MNKARKFGENNISTVAYWSMSIDYTHYYTIFLIFVYIFYQFLLFKDLV